MRALSERRDDLQRVADDPDATPAERQQAIVDGLALAHGLGMVAKAQSRLDDDRTALRGRAEWLATVKAYRGWMARPANGDRRPTQADIAAERRMGERTLALKLRAIGIEDWHDVHALVEAWPEG
jgi:hypothetical protein